MNPLLATPAILSFLDSFSSRDRRRGKHCFLDHAVLKTSCLKADQQYLAIVRGSQDYRVAFEYNGEKQSWSATCSCPTGLMCKHVYAGMLALQANAAALAAPAANGKAAGNSGATRKRKPKAEPSPAPQLVQPPPTALCMALTQALGRSLNEFEAEMVRRAQWVYQEVRSGIGVRSEHLRRFAPAIQDYSWTALSLWPSMPRNDHQLWLYCAWELRGGAWPFQPSLGQQRTLPKSSPPCWSGNARRKLISGARVSRIPRH